MNTLATRGLAALCLLAAVPCARAIVITQTTTIGGNTTTPWAGVIFNAAPALSPTGDGPLTSVAVSLSVTGSVTLLEANALLVPGATWTPNLTLNGTLGGTGPFFLNGAQSAVTGPLIVLPPPGQFASWTGTISQTFTALLTAPSALGAWTGAGNGFLAYSGQLFAVESYGEYKGDFTATFTVVYNHVPEGGGSAALLASALGLLAALRRRLALAS